MLSNGHASMLLWSVLHLTGDAGGERRVREARAAVGTLDDIRRFRQLDSKAPGHPEYHWVSGVETTTGPLGQGVATSVGMAIAQKWLASRYNRPGFEIFDYHIYAVCGDGCLMEGVASEAASLAGHLGLDNLCWIYDNNHITIEGDTSLAFTEDVAARFLGYGWNVLRVGDANDIDRIEHALDVFRKTTGPAHVHHPRQPHRLWLAEQAGHRGSPRRAARRGGSPPHQARLRLARGRASSSCPTASASTSPPASARAARQRAQALDRALRGLPRQVSRTRDRDRSDAAPRAAGRLGRNLPVFPADAKGMAGRDASGKVLNVLAQNIPWLLGGSADLGPSNKTTLTYEGAGDFQADSPGGQEPALRHPRARDGARS